MKTAELNQYNLAELNSAELANTEGGSLLNVIGMIVKAIADQVYHID